MKTRTHLRLPFWTFLGLTLLVGFVAVNGVWNLLYWVLGVMIAALLISVIVSTITLHILRPRRVLPARARVGETVVIRYAITNRARVIPAFNVHVTELETDREATWSHRLRGEPAWIMHVGPRETVHGEAVFTPLARGVANFRDLRVSTSFPFGIFARSSRRSAPQRLLIEPRVHNLRRGLLRTLSPSGGIGVRVSARVGAGEDYYGLREFREGDSPRQIAWKRTANRDQLLSIDRTHPEPPRVRVVLNLCAEDAASDREETAISLAASVLHTADLEGYEFGLSIAGFGDVAVPLGRGYRHRNKLLAALAAIDLDLPRRPAGPVGPRETDRVGLVVVHPDRPDPSIVSVDALHLSATQLEVLCEAVPAEAAA